MVKKNMLKRLRGDKRRYSPVFDTLVYVILIFVFLVTLIPILYVVSVALTPYSEVAKNQGFVLIPKKITLEAFEMIMSRSDFWNGMKVTIEVTVFGTLANLVVTTAFAYPLSRKNLPGRSFITKMVMFTMIFSAGTIPTYLVVKGTGLLNTMGAYIVPGLVSVSNLIIMKSFFENLPEDVFDAARIDGCNEFKLLTRVVLPMSVPIMLTIGMYYAVAHWNTYMAAVLYVTDNTMQPMQVILRRLLDTSITDMSADVVVPTETLRMAAVCFCTLPIVVVYPFIQKYFVKGTLAGAVKG